MELLPTILDCFDRRQQYTDLLESSRQQDEMLKQELKDIDKENSAKVNRLDERVKESSAALENFKRKHDEERRSLEKEIENERLNNAKQLEELDESFLRRKAEADNLSKEQLREIQAKNREERAELMAAQRKALEAKKMERDELRAAHRQKMEAAEEEHRKIIQERKDRLVEHTKEIAQVKNEHNKKFADEQNELLKIKQDVLEEQRKLIKRETELRMRICDDNLKTQMMNMNSDNERNLANSLGTMLRYFIESIEACKQLKDNFEEIENDAGMGLLFISNSNHEWNEANNSTRNAAHYLKGMINNYTTINTKFRDDVNKAMGGIVKTVLEKQSLVFAISRHASNKEIKELQSLLPQIENHITQLEQMAETAGQICAPHDASVQMMLCSAPPQSSSGMIDN